MPELLSMSEVSKGFWRGKHWMSVLEDVSLHVAAGEVAAVIGSREEGKTTLLKLAAGIENPDRGCVSIAGQDMAAMSGHTRERLLGEQIAWIDRERPGFSWRAWEYVALPLILSRRQNRHRAQQIALVALEGMNAAPCAARRWSDLSNWERVLVGLARALASHPQIIILDDLLDGFGTVRIHEAGDRLKWMAEELRCGVLMSTSGIETTLLADSVWSFSHRHLTPLAGQAGSADAEVIDLFKASRPGTGTRDSR